MPLQTGWKITMTKGSFKLFLPSNPEWLKMRIALLRQAQIFTIKVQDTIILQVFTPNTEFKNRLIRMALK